MIVLRRRWGLSKPPLGAQLNPGHPLAMGLVSRWLLNEGAGALAVDLTRRNRGTLVSGPTWTPTGRGTGLLFDATDDHIELTSTVLTDGQPFSIAWWELVTATTNAFPSRFSLPVAGGTYLNVIRSNSASYLALHVTTSPNAQSGLRAAGAPSLASSVGIWRHWVVTGSDPSRANGLYDTEFEIYCDRVSYSVSSGGGYSAISTNRIGHDGTDSPADAILDDISIYNRRLTPTEAQWLSTEPYAMLVPPGPARWYSFPAAGDGGGFFWR